MNKKFEVSSLSPLYVVVAWILATSLMVYFGILHRPLSNDEAHYYLPIIEQFANSLPFVPISDYSFPGPPLGILLQSFVYSVFEGDWIFVRGLSYCILLCLPLIWCARYSRAGLGVSQVLLLLTPLSLPFFLQHGFTLRQHVLAVLLLSIGFFQTDRLESDDVNRGDVIRVLCLSLATLIHQFTLIYSLALLIGLCLKDGTLDIAITRKKLVFLFPLVPLIFLSFLWGGLTPPSFTETVYSHASASVALGALKHLVLLLLSVGIWLAPVFGLSGLFRLRMLPLWFTCFLICYASEGLSESVSFYLAVVGPVTNSFRAIVDFMGLRSELALCALTAIPMTIGLSLIISERATKGNTRIFRLFTVLYFLMMLLVPHFFESYYMYYLVISYWLLSPSLLQHRKLPLRPTLFLLGITVLGFFYTNVTLFLRR